MAAPLLHLTTPPSWREALAAGAVRPDAGQFVHLSTPEQVALPANRLFAGRPDLLLLACDPARIDVEVRFEPGLPTDPPQLRFPHAYGPMPASAVLAVLPYRPGPQATFTAPGPVALDATGRVATLEPSVLRRAATREVPVSGGVAVRTDPVPDSHRHNMLLLDGPTDAATIEADADRALAGLRHRCALLSGAAHAPTAGALGARGWIIEELVRMAAPAGGSRTDRVEQLDLDALRPLWDAAWHRDVPAMPGAVVAQLSERYRLEEPVVDLRYLAVRDGGDVVAAALLKLDGATACLDALGTDVAHRGRGHGDLLVAEARALAAEAGCDLVGLEAAAADWPRHWYARRGFAEVDRAWFATRR